MSSQDSKIHQEPNTPKDMMKFLYSFKPVGNVIDSTWAKILTWEKTGKPHYEAMALLGDIFYWYRPRVEKDARGNITLKKRYHADILQRSYDQIVDTLNMTKDSARTAAETLERVGVAKREFRTVVSNGMKNGNVMFIRFFPRKLQELQENMLVIGDEEPNAEGVDSNIYPYGLASHEGVASDPIGVGLKPMTYTETTSESSSEKDNVSPPREEKKKVSIGKLKQKDFSKALNPDQKKAHDKLMAYTPQWGEKVISEDVCAWMLSLNHSTERILEAFLAYKQDVDDAIARKGSVDSMGGRIRSILNSGRKPRDEMVEENKKFAEEISKKHSCVEVKERYVRISTSTFRDELHYTRPVEVFKSWVLNKLETAKAYA